MNKGTIILTLILLVMMMVLPSAVFVCDEDEIGGNLKENNSTNTQTFFRVYHPDKKTVQEYTAEEYVVGVVAGEMDISFQDEAIKAQAVAAYTLALHRKERRSKKPDESILCADLTADSSVDQAFLTKDEIKDKWGENFEDNYKRLRNLVESVLGEHLTYQGEIAQTVYHDTSGGKTETAENIWGRSIPYLVSVQSAGDLLNPKYVTKVTVAGDEFISKVNEKGAKVTNDTLAKSISITSRSESGTVLSVKIGEKTFKGTEIRQMFNLRSSNFDIIYKENNAEFTVMGYGHGVGMSQYGANVMAQQGSGYKDILKWYYKGCEISK